MSAYVLLGVLILLSLARPLLYKKASMTLDHNSGPIFTGVWVLIALCAVYPFYGTLIQQGLEAVT